MRILLALFLVCLSGCVAMPPTYGGVLYHGDCAVHWQPHDFPLHVVVDTRLTPAQQEALQAAVLSWNEAVGTTVFSIDREIDWFDIELLDPRHSTVYVVPTDLPDENLPNIALGLCSVLDTECRIDTAYVFLDVAVRDVDAMLIFKHELGHALGLSHDTWRPSVMFHFVLQSGTRIMADDINFIQWELTDGNQRNPSIPESEAVGWVRSSANVR